MPSPPSEPTADQVAVTAHGAGAGQPTPQQSTPQQSAEPAAGGSSGLANRPDQVDAPVRADAIGAPVAPEQVVSTGHLMAADSVEKVIDKRAKPDGSAGAGEPDDGEANQLTQVIKAVK